MESVVSNFIVLADDDRDHGIVFHHILKKVDPDKKLTVVTDGAALMDLLSKSLPEILFLDLNMPCKTGLECLQEIRATPYLKDLKVVVYSSSAKMTDIQKSYIHRADLYMVKPFNSEHLRNALETVLKQEWWRTAPSKNQYFINNRFVPFTAQA
jgi:CheY-like chemotaxis protein